MLGYNGYYEESIKLFRDLISRAGQFLSFQRQTLFSLLDVYKKTKADDMIEEAYLGLLEKYMDALSPDDICSRVCFMRDLAKFYQERGRYADAKKIFGRIFT